eukprot:GHVL01005671.1.p1 GENE.GHVL01005671.1~~GHVL01005671.1.p1  ORF type:complete len:460 (-),score=96.39 GHVL01005671.1:48-1427(-)
MSTKIIYIYKYKGGSSVSMQEMEKVLEIERHPNFQNLKYLQDDSIFGDWNKAIFRNCDGTGFSGALISPLVQDGVSLYFRGKFILDAAIADLLLKGLSRADEIVISGNGPGAFGVYSHVDHLAELLPNNIKIAGLADSGYWFDDVKLPVQGWLTEFWNHLNVAPGISNECLENAEVDLEWRCQLPTEVLKYTEIPIFSFTSIYDSWMIEYLKTDEEINAFGVKLRQLSVNVMDQSTTAHGLFLTSCALSSEGFDFLVDSQSSQSPEQAFETWFEQKDDRTIWQQVQNYPCAECCENRPETPDDDIDDGPIVEEINPKSIEAWHIAVGAVLLAILIFIILIIIFFQRKKKKKLQKAREAIRKQKSLMRQATLTRSRTGNLNTNVEVKFQKFQNNFNVAFDTPNTVYTPEKAKKPSSPSSGSRQRKSESLEIDPHIDLDDDDDDTTPLSKKNSPKKEDLDT